MNDEIDKLTDDINKRFRIGARQWYWFFIVLAIGLAGIVFQLLRRKGLNDSALLYIGVPFIMALVISLTPRMKSVMGGAMKAVTIAILLSAPIFNEGFLCILFAAPIFYSVAAVCALILSALKDASQKRGKDRLKLAGLTVIIASLSLEGSHEQFSIERYQEASYTTVLPIGIDALKSQLENPFEDYEPEKISLPFFLSVFPKPVSAVGGGLQIGDRIELQYEYPKWFVANIHKGSAVYELVDSQENGLIYSIEQDDSYLSHYLTWHSSEVYWREISETETEVTWRLSYERKLDPSWYFGPMEQYAVWLTAKTLVEYVATPQSSP